MVARDVAESACGVFRTTMAALAQLCKGDRTLRDRARLYIDRVKIWETQGNARSVKEINTGVPAVCVWLANEAYVLY